MAFSSSSSSSISNTRPTLPFLFRVLFFFIIFNLSSMVNSVSFDFTSFDPRTVTSCKEGTGGICPQGDATIQSTDHVIQLTKTDANISTVNSVGRASYSDSIRLWDNVTGEIASFNTQFSFIFNASGSGYGGDGLAFFLSAFPSTIPTDIGENLLGLFDKDTSLDNSTTNRLVAVEFDTSSDHWDPKVKGSGVGHVGINVNSIKSVATVPWNRTLMDGRKARAEVRYDSTTHNLSVVLRYADREDDGMGSGSFPDTTTLSHIVDLRKILPEQVAVGFSASDLHSEEVHSILSWSFFCSDLESTQYFSSSNNEEASMDKLKLGAYIFAATILVVGGLCFAWHLKRRKKRSPDSEEEEGRSFGKKGQKKKQEEEGSIDKSIRNKLEEKGKGPRRYSYKELAEATNSFSKDRRLGEGGFGTVYRGFLPDINADVAVKKISKKSKQGKKEFVSEVNIISLLRHRNLVQLIGWCHEQTELLLVYEFMPRGSLDSMLFEDDHRHHPLTWTLRYKIALGIASALHYLHEECDQCVVHRDVKSCNIMLDSDFTAKLGDFGLARSVDHERGPPPTTILAGTMGYMAPECVMTGRASKESDVYSFGVVALEIASGRRAIDPRAEDGIFCLVEWAWILHGKGELLKAMDRRLVAVDSEVNEREVERLMLVGLWCANPDMKLRPSMGQACAALHMEAPIPILPTQMPVPIRSPSVMQIEMFQSTTSSLWGVSSTATPSTSSVSIDDWSTVTC